MPAWGDALRAYLGELEDWAPLSRAALVGWLIFYALFFVHAATDRDGFLFMDNANLVVHEVGHLLFSWLGRTMSLYGGTLLQFLAPLALTAYFWERRQTAGFAFAVFCVFENFLYTSHYVADARAQLLPLVTVGDPAAGGHDWFLILSRWGLLRYDTALGGLLRVVGWVGMLAVPVWLVRRQRRQEK